MIDSDLEELHNRRGATSPGRRRAAALAGGSTELVVGAFEHRTDRAITARESGDYDYMMLEKMVEQTLDPYRHIPAVEMVAALGVKPIVPGPEGDRIRRELNATLLYPSVGTGRRFFGVRFRVDKTVFQYGLTTGARTGLNGDNDWVDSLIDLLEECRPRELIAGTFSRIARVTPQFTRLEAPIKAARSKVVTFEVPDGIDLRTNAGLDTWHSLARGVEADYRASVMRLITGTVYELKHNRYPRAGVCLPPGYVKKGGRGPDKHKVLVDSRPESQQFVRTFIELAASDHTDDEIIAALIPLGLRARQPKLVAEGRTAPEEVSDPRRMLRSLYPFLLTYRDGTYRFQHEIPLPDLDELAGFPVRRAHPHDNGFIRVDLDFGIPVGGWAERDLIDQAIAKRLPHGPAPAPVVRDTLKPLSSLIRWADEEWEHFLLAPDGDSYELRRRPAGTAETAKGRRAAFTDDQGELIGRFAARVLHSAVARILSQVATGLPADLPCPEAPLEPAARLARLERLRDEARRRSHAAQNEVLRVEDPETKQRYRELAEKKLHQSRRFAAKVAKEEAKRRPAPSFTYDLNRLAGLIKILDGLEGSADASVARALRSMVVSARITGAERTNPTAHLEMTLRIRTDTGSIILGPVSEPVRNRAVGGKPDSDERRKGFAKRNRNILEVLLLEAAPEEERRELWMTEGFTGRSYIRRMTEVLRPIVGPAVTSAVIYCPIVDVRRAALEPRLHHGIALSDGFGEELGDEIARMYAPPGFSWPDGWCPGGMATERQILGLVHRYAPDPEVGLPIPLVVQALATTPNKIYRMAHEGAAAYGRRREGKSTAPWYVRLELIKGSKKRPGFVRIRRCPHCGQRSLLQPLRVPEVAGYLLCVNPACRKALLNGLRYSDEFFLPWEGPQSMVRRCPETGSAKEQAWFSTSGRLIVGTTLSEVHIPSIHAPRGLGDAPASDHTRRR